MEQVFEIAAGIDVHKDTVVVTIRGRSAKGRDTLETRTFETFHDSLHAMARWLSTAGVAGVGLESTGVYWKPVVRAIRDSALGMVIWLLNPNHVKKVPGRKTDVSDSQWLSKLVMYGLVSPSFLPSTHLDELRKLTRHRVKLVADQVRFTNRILKELEGSGIKLDSVCSDPLGKSSRAMIEALLQGRRDLDAVADLAQGALRNKIPLLRRAIEGSFTSATAFVLRQLLQQLDYTREAIAKVESEIATLAAPLKDDIDRLCTAPGFDTTSATALLAETGADMSVFSSAKHVSAWAGVCPGSNQSGGKLKEAPTRKGDKYLRTILVTVAWCAVRKKDSYWKRRFGHLVRLGPKKAIVAVARSILTAAFHMLRDGQNYREPEALPPDPTKRAHLLKRHTAQIEALGYQVTLIPISAAASVS